MSVVNRWVMPVVVLLCELVRPGKEALKEIELNMLSRDTWREVVARGGDDVDMVYREIIKASSGLSDDDLKRLCMPDYNSLLAKVEDMFGKPSGFWFDVLGVNMGLDDRNVLPLLKPLETLEWGDIDQIELKYPSVASVDLMNKQPAEKQTDFIVSDCTGLGPDELGQLSVPDWRALEARVIDFLSQTGSFFLSVKT